MTSKAPPIVSPASLARSIAAIMRCSTSTSTQRSGASERQGARGVERHRRAGRKRLPADGEDMAGDAGPGATEQLPRHGAGRDPRGGFAGARALEDVPHVRASVLGDTREIRVARPGLRDRRAPCATGIGGGLGRRAHRVLPVHPVPVGDRHRDRSADRFARPDAGQDLGAVGFDRHPPSPPVPALPAAQVLGDGVDVDGEPCGNAFEDDDERAAV